MREKRERALEERQERRFNAIMRWIRLREEEQERRDAEARRSPCRFL